MDDNGSMHTAIIIKVVIIAKTSNALCTVIFSWILNSALPTKNAEKTRNNVNCSSGLYCRKLLLKAASVNIPMKTTIIINTKLPIDFIRLKPKAMNGKQR